MVTICSWEGGEDRFFLITYSLHVHEVTVVMLISTLKAIKVKYSVDEFVDQLNPLHFHYNHLHQLL